MTVMTAETKSFFAGLGGVLLNGVSKAIDGEVLQRYGTYGGQVVQDRVGNTVPAGTPFTETVADLGSTRNLVLVGVGLVLVLVLAKSLAR